jgi:hypothetical protein
MPEPEKLTKDDVIEFVQRGWDATLMAAYDQLAIDIDAGTIDSIAAPITTQALIDVFMATNVIEDWADVEGPMRLMVMLELIRLGCEARMTAFDVEMDTFLAKLLGGEHD